MPPRDDTYMRLLAILMLPLAAGLFTGWPDMALSWGWLGKLSWLGSFLLLIYYCAGSRWSGAAALTAAVISLALALIVVNFANMGVTAVTGPLYSDMLPSGPWQGLAGGHSPEVTPGPGVVPAPATIAATSAGGPSPMVEASTMPAPGVPEVAATGPAEPL